MRVGAASAAGVSKLSASKPPTSTGGATDSKETGAEKVESSKANPCRAEEPKCGSVASSAAKPASSSRALFCSRSS